MRSNSLSCRLIAWTMVQSLTTGVAIVGEKADSVANPVSPLVFAISPSFPDHHRHLLDGGSLRPSDCWRLCGQFFRAYRFRRPAPRRKRRSVAQVAAVLVASARIACTRWLGLGRRPPAGIGVLIRVIGQGIEARHFCGPPPSRQLAPLARTIVIVRPLAQRLRNRPWRQPRSPGLARGLSRVPLSAQLIVPLALVSRLCARLSPVLWYHSGRWPAAPSAQGYHQRLSVPPSSIPDRFIAIALSMG